MRDPKDAHELRAAQSSADETCVAEAGPAVRHLLLAWYAAHARDLPWRRTKDPYAIWLSEVMLQQTRVETVIPYYERFLGRYPTVLALAEAPLEDVLARWSGLGYYRRARALHAGAQQMASGDGAVPRTLEGLRAIGGIGPYTAGAIASIAFGTPTPLVDGNVARVLARLFTIEDDVRKPHGLARVWKVAGALVPQENAGAWNQALMELGATVCTPRSPQCLVCPVRSVCGARAEGRQDELPRLAPKKKPVHATRVAVVAVKGDAILLARRNPAGLFAGLWEPPSLHVDVVVDDEAAGLAPRAMRRALKELAKLTGLPDVATADPARFPRVEHVLSHRRLVVLVHRVVTDGVPALAASDDYDRLELVARTRVGERGISTLARKIIDAGDASTSIEVSAPTRASRPDGRAAVPPRRAERSEDPSAPSPTPDTARAKERRRSPPRARS